MREEMSHLQLTWTYLYTHHEDEGSTVKSSVALESTTV
jgi:hypothetical protein